MQVQVLFTEVLETHLTCILLLNFPKLILFLSPPFLYSYITLQFFLLLVSDCNFLQLHALQMCWVCNLLLYWSAVMLAEEFWEIKFQCIWMASELQKINLQLNETGKVMAETFLKSGNVYIFLLIISIKHNWFVKYFREGEY